MDYWSRLTLVSIVGGAIGALIGYYFGNMIPWVFFCLAAAIATDESFQIMGKSKKFEKFQSASMPQRNEITRRLPRQKPPKPRF